MVRARPAVNTSTARKSVSGAAWAADTIWCPCPEPISTTSRAERPYTAAGSIAVPAFTLVAAAARSTGSR